MALLLLGHHLEEFPVLDVNSETLRNEKAEPLKRLLIEASLGERILPVGNTQVHNE